jgi:hypothetical protein
MTMTPNQIKDEQERMRLEAQAATAGRAVKRLVGLALALCAIALAIALMKG